MAEATALLFAYCETPLHAGTGRALCTVDLPIQREQITGYPIVQASSVKGVLRAATQPNGSGNDQKWHRALFGPERPEEAHTHAGALQVSDLQVVLFPVRSLSGVFAWTTSPTVLARLRRLAQLAGIKSPFDPGLFSELDSETCADSKGSALRIQASKQVGVVLEEFSFRIKDDLAHHVTTLGQWLSEQALPQSDEYKWWRQQLSDHLCVLPDDAFRDFVLYGTEIETHVRLDNQTKTVETGALWTTEALPAESLLVGLLAANRSRYWDHDKGGQELLDDLLERINGRRLRLGGDETTGHGTVIVRITQREGAGT